MSTHITKDPENITEAHNAFGFSALGILANENSSKNIFISPLSISLALSTIDNGAQGETKSAIEKTLKFQHIDTSTVNQESKKLLTQLQTLDSGISVSIANSIWVTNGIDLKEDFLNSVANYFDTKISNLDFSNTNAAETIKAWINKNTNGKIAGVATPIPRDTVMYLVNSIYFKGSWTPGFEFNERLTATKNFTGTDGTNTKIPFMHQEREMYYLETKDFQSVILPYGKKAHLSMYVFLPKNMKDFMKTLDQGTWESWMKQYKITEGTLILPKFKIEYKESLVPLLTQLGMGIAFEDNADFTGIGKNLKISEVEHQSYIDLNETGTEAAATTSVTQAATAAPPSEKTFSMDVNHPFFFAIRDNQTQEILFMGTVQNL